MPHGTQLDRQVTARGAVSLSRPDGHAQDPAELSYRPGVASLHRPDPILLQSSKPLASFAPRGGEPRVLVVDDHPVNLEVLGAQLRLLGIEAETVSSSADALATWVPGRYAAVLADIHMPHEDGYELARRLRAAEAKHGVTPTPIIAVTANAMKGEEERCLAAGMDAYLVKPVSFERLRGTLERWLANPERRQRGPADGLAQTRHRYRPQRTCGLGR